jgi:hypothetical protein
VRNSFELKTPAKQPELLVTTWHSARNCVAYSLYFLPDSKVSRVDLGLAGLLALPLVVLLAVLAVVLVATAVQDQVAVVLVLAVVLVAAVLVVVAVAAVVVVALGQVAPAPADSTDETDWPATSQTLCQGEARAIQLGRLVAGHLRSGLAGPRRFLRSHAG